MTSEANIICKLQLQPSSQSQSQLHKIKNRKNNMRNQGPIYNTHSLFLYTGVAEKEQIVECFKQAIIALGKPCRFKVNPVWASKEEYLGCTFIWVSSPAVYYAFTGRNLDGSERIEYVSDDNWSPPSTPKEEEIEKIERIEDISTSSNVTWAEMGELDDLKAEIELKYERPIIRRNLPPLITELKYRYTEEQKEYLSQKDKNIPDYGSFVIRPSHVIPLDDKYCHNVLTCKRVPSFVNEKNMKNIMRYYASDPFKEVTRNYRGVIMTDTYPFIVITERAVKRVTTEQSDEVRAVKRVTTDQNEQNWNQFNETNGTKELNEKNEAKETQLNEIKLRTAFITFDPATDDARFALQMTKRLEVFDPENPEKKEIMYFDHSLNSFGFK